MAYFLGQLIGGAIICTFLAMLVGLMFKRKEPSERAFSASLIAWFVGGFLSAAGHADGGPFRFSQFLIFLPGAVAAFFFLRWHYEKKLRRDAGSHAEG